MRSAFGLLALAAAVSARPQGVADGIAPSAPPPAGCSENYPGTFQITVVNVTASAAKLRKRQSQPLELTLSGGVLKDAKGRTGSIVANYQFQFDGPPQVSSCTTRSCKSKKELTFDIGWCNLHRRLLSVRKW